MVRLITHNLLACHAKGCTSNNFPLQFKDVTIELRETEFNPEFIRGFLPRLEWKALVGAAKEVRSFALFGCVEPSLTGVAVILCSPFTVTQRMSSWAIHRYRTNYLR